jgi:two-component sensor histidine kinase
VALLLHEFRTNSAKYGALSTPNGQVEIVGAEYGQTYVLTWTERGGPAIPAPPDNEGFGATLTRATVSGQLGGRISQDWRPEGLVIRPIPAARAFDGMNWAKRPPLHSRASLWGYA